MGPFALEIYTGANGAPDTTQLARAEQLVSRFELDSNYILNMIHAKYTEFCSQDYVEDLLMESGLESGRSALGVIEYLHRKALVICEDLTASVYLSPQWDEEHGLIFDLTPEGWVDGSSM